MTNYNWKVQLSEFYSDQFEEKGPVDKEKAVEAFQFFPWEKEIDDYKGRNDNPTIPRIIFYSQDDRVLDISTVNLKGFEVEYNNFGSNKYSEFYISNDFNKKNWTIEELIEFFFDNSLEEYISLEESVALIEYADVSNTPEFEEEIKKEAIEKEKKLSKNMEFDFKPTHLKTLGFNTFMMVGLSITLLIMDSKGAKVPVFWHILFFLYWLPSFILHFTYYLKNNNAKVIIDIRNHDLTYIKGKTEIKFNRDDIFLAQVVSVSRGTMSWSNYSYLWFILKDKRKVVITCFIDKPHAIAETLNCKYEEHTRTIPFLP